MRFAPPALVFFAMTALTGCQAKAPPSAASTRPGINPDNAITLREASLFHARLMDLCEENRVGLAYKGILADDRTIPFGLVHSWDQTLWDVTSIRPGMEPRRQLRRVLCEIRLARVHPTAGVWVSIWIEGHPFYAKLDETYNISPDVGQEVLKGKTPRDFLNQVRDAMPESGFVPPPEHVRSRVPRVGS